MYAINAYFSYKFNLQIQKLYLWWPFCSNFILNLKPIVASKGKT